MVVYAILAVILAVLSVFPRQYDAKTKLLPQEEGSSGLAATLNIGAGLQNFASQIGTHQTAEVYLLLARSNDVALAVIKQQNLLGRPGFTNLDQARRRLAHEVDVHTLTGGVLEIEAKDTDPEFAKRLVATFSQVIQDRARALSLEQTAKKRTIIEARFKDAIANLARAHAALDQFRRENKLAQPQTEFSMAVGLKAALQGQLQDALVQMQSAQQFATGDNIQVQQLQARIDSLRSQIAQADAAGLSAPDSLAGIANKADEYYELYREEQFQESLAQTYERSMEQVVVEQIGADANNNVQVIEAPFVSANHPLNVPALALLLVLAVVAFVTEIYAPMTGVGLRRRRTAGVATQA
jgi:hypothetical protein